MSVLLSNHRYLLGTMNGRVSALRNLRLRRRLLGYSHRREERSAGYLEIIRICKEEREDYKLKERPHNYILHRVARLTPRDP